MKSVFKNVLIAKLIFLGTVFSVYAQNMVIKSKNGQSEMMLIDNLLANIGTRHEPLIGITVQASFSGDKNINVQKYAAIVSGCNKGEGDYTFYFGATENIADNGYWSLKSDPLTRNMFNGIPHYVCYMAARKNMYESLNKNTPATETVKIAGGGVLYPKSQIFISLGR